MQRDGTTDDVSTVCMLLNRCIMRFAFAGDTGLGRVAEESGPLGDMSVNLQSSITKEAGHHGQLWSITLRALPRGLLLR